MVSGGRALKRQFIGNSVIALALVLIAITIPKLGRHVASSHVLRNAEHGLHK